MRSIKIILFVVTAVLLVPNLTKSQEPLKHKKKIYKAADGKLYANKDLPIYFRVATSSDANAESYLLVPSAGSKKYANPMYFDTEGYNTFRSPSKVDTVTKEIVYPLEDVIFEMYSDSRPPKTNFKFGTKKYYKKDTLYYFGEKISVEFDTYDATSGLENTYISMDGQAFKKLDSPIDLNEEKLYKIKYYSVDNVGNAEKPKLIYVKIDITKPTTKLSVDPDLYNDIISPRSKITLESSDENSKIKKTVFALNGGTLYNYNRPIVISGLKEGEHTITYYSIDNVGNEETEKQYTFYLDKTAPLIVDELIGNTFIANGKEYSSGRSKVKLTAMDNKAGVKEIRYSINSSEFIEYTKPFYLSKSGKLRIQTFVTDNVNNQSIKTIMTNKSSISYVDLSGPTLGHSFRGPNFNSRDTAYITSNTKIRLAANDDASGYKRMEYSIDNKEIIEYTESFSITDEGIHSVTYSGYDNVDNSTTNTFICVEDNTGPEIFFRFSILSDNTKRIGDKNYDVYPNHVVLFLSSTDSSVGFHNMLYSINGSPDKAYTSLITGFQKEKLYTIKVTSIDKLGNKNQNTIEFYVE
ncbi:OmpL47-type beta-barrel domain-containing protein [Bacteroidota bacterium]